MVEHVSDSVLKICGCDSQTICIVVVKQRLLAQLHQRQRDRELADRVAALWYVQ